MLSLEIYFQILIDRITSHLLSCLVFTSFNRCVFNSPCNKSSSNFMETTVSKKSPYQMCTQRAPNTEDPCFLTQHLPSSALCILCKFITPLQSHKGLRTWQNCMVQRPSYQVNKLATSTRNIFFFVQNVFINGTFCLNSYLLCICWIRFWEVCCENRSWKSSAEFCNKINSKLSYFSEL